MREERSMLRTVATLLLIWLAIVLAAAAGVVLGAFVIMQYVATYLAEVGKAWTAVAL